MEFVEFPFHYYIIHYYNITRYSDLTCFNIVSVLLMLSFTDPILSLSCTIFSKPLFQLNFSSSWSYKEELECVIITVFSNQLVLQVILKKNRSSSDKHLSSLCKNTTSQMYRTAAY